MEWIITAKPTGKDGYRALDAFSDLGRIHWHKTKPMNGVSVDDIVYIYIGVEVDEEWGRLKSGAGWICLDFVNRV